MFDASHRMYLAHVPLAIIGQLLLVGAPIHYHPKFLLICVVVTILVLVTYQFCVRYTFIGRALNGSWTRRQPPAPARMAQSGLD